jgi:hypothetical protein
MPTEDIQLRVNGLVITTVTHRREIVDGYPGGKSEIVVDEFGIGQFSLTDECILEIQRGEGPWQRVNLRELSRIITSAVEQHVSQHLLSRVPGRISPR